jgi:hypothetical protein
LRAREAATPQLAKSTLSQCYLRGYFLRSSREGSKSTWNDQGCCVSRLCNLDPVCGHSSSPLRHVLALASYVAHLPNPFASSRIRGFSYPKTCERGSTSPRKSHAGIACNHSKKLQLGGGIPRARRMGLKRGSTVPIRCYHIPNKKGVDEQLSPDNATCCGR